MQGPYHGFVLSKVGIKMGCALNGLVEEYLVKAVVLLGPAPSDFYFLVNNTGIALNPQSGVQQQPSCRRPS